MYYQKDDFIGYSHIQHLVPKFDNFNMCIAHTIITACKISTANQYDYGNKYNRKAMNATKIQLPTKNNQPEHIDDKPQRGDISVTTPLRAEMPDYELMEVLIRAVQKLVIRDVVEWVDAQNTLG